MQLPKRFVLMDTEFTAWAGPTRGWDEPGKYKEIIQIGCVLCEAATLAESGVFSAFVRPVKNPILSGYIKDLTGISQEDVDAGSTLDGALEAFAAFCGTDTVYSWGKDESVLRENCALIGIPFPMSHEQFIDISELIVPILAEQGIDATAYHSGTLLAAFGKTGDREHNAVNDMRNFLEVLRELRMRGAL